MPVEVFAILKGPRIPVMKLPVNRASGVALGILLLAGCAVGPDYKRADVNTPAGFRGQAGAAQQASIADLPWWEVFKDDNLQKLIREALISNYDLRIAIARIDESRASEMQIASPLWPQIGYQGGVARGKNTFLGSPTPIGGGTNNSALLALNAAWEIDLWGRVRRLDEAAEAQFFASEEARRGVMLSLVSSVAQAYFELLELDRELEIAKYTTGSFQESLDIFTKKLQAGVVSKLETSRAEAAQAATAATIPEIERLIVLKENQIHALLGQNPGPISRTKTLLEQTTPPEVPAGVPSALLERRPDIRQAEEQLRAANAQVGVAVADFLPQIGLTSLMGRVSPELSIFTTGKANMWAAAANMAGPIFQGGRLIGQHDEAVARWEEAKLVYEQTALNAFREVSDALTTRVKLEEIRAQQARSVQAYEEAVKVSMQRYDAGKASYFEVLEAQQDLFPQQTGLARTQLNQLLVIVQLYKSLGGGWNLPDEKWGPSAAPPHKQKTPAVSRKPNRSK